MVERNHSVGENETATDQQINEITKRCNSFSKYALGENKMLEI